MARFDPKLFKFNLLVQPKEELEAIEERDDSMLYAILLVFFASIVYLGLILLQNFLINPRVASLTTAIDQQKQAIASYASVQSAHGELFIKSKSLTSVLNRNIDPAEIFRVTGEMVKSNPSLAIESYSREKSGAFVFGVVSRSFSEVVDLIKNTEAITGVSDVFVRSSILSADTKTVKTIIALNIDAIKSQTAE